MKKFLFSIFLILSFVVLPAGVYGIELGTKLVNDTAEKAGFDKNTNEQSLAQNMGAVIKLLLSFTGSIFLILTVYAGFLWMSARGDEGKVDKAQEIVKAAIIGLAITIGAYSITSFVVPRIVNQSTGDAAPISGVGGKCQTSLDCGSGTSCRAEKCVEL